jgi:hypothetical protein
MPAINIAWSLTYPVHKIKSGSGRHGAGANGHGTLIFLTLHIHGANIFFTNEMPMGQTLFLMHYFMAEFS